MIFEESITFTVQKSPNHIIMLVVKLIAESFKYAFQSIVVNRLRTFLSLSGITIGIFSVIAVFSVFDSLERSIRDSLSELGNDVLFIQKWPWAMGEDYPWWKYMNRPNTTIDELEAIQERVDAAQAAAFNFALRRTVKYLNNSYDNATIQAVSHDYEQVMPLDIVQGRYFNPLESQAGRNVAVVGADIAETLFPQTDPLGKTIKIFGSKATVIGILKAQGQGTFGSSSDKQVYVPLNFARNFVNMRRVGTTIMVKTRDKGSNQQLRDELTGLMRSLRKLKPGEEDNFSINEVSIINQGLQVFFSALAMIGWIIGGFSLLVGGFGIANIMFVSVRERTNIIGIQKAIGAKRFFILLEFLFEAVFLSLLGGLLGLLLIYIGTLLVQDTMPFPIILTFDNIVVGLIISMVIGLVSGFMPALTASRLDPVEAIRFGI
ncbi:MAG: ABC transporter permease [Bacteroidales bacterium]|nr:ABC transporter permease [Bacteroidales bacterium]MDD2631792.1 ABC transporter permease [Bacteroidales bacterium]MDD3130504.1 ABC transporter permease [Bacteroidales bacterium]MDD4177169.1 ABC transporter permease [Bacteroidales bacterium]MDD4741368.1 ABC transporter permease [Bacteroidales bacterium]